VALAAWLVCGAALSVLAPGAWAQAEPASADRASPDAAPSRAPSENPSGPGSDRFKTAVERSQLRERALDLLVEASLGADPLLRANAIEGLQAAPKRAENAVRAGLQDENAGVRFVCAMTVGQLKLRASVPFVEPLLSDPDPRVRGAAILALTLNGKKIDQTPLAQLLASDDARIRAEGARLVGLVGNPTAIPMLKSSAAAADRRNRLSNGGAQSETQYQLERLFQLQLAEALARLGDASALDSLRAALYPSSREGFESAALAAQILGLLKDTKSAAQLVELVEQRVTPEDGGAAPGGAPGDAAPTGRGSRRDGKSGPRQGEFLQPKEVRLAAAGALAQMGYPDGMYVARSYMNDAEPAIRAQSAFVLGWGGQVQDLASLEGLMSDSDGMVRVSAAAAAVRALSRK
jgi:HEAT repeat protein